MKSILKFIGSSLLSAALVGGALVAHMNYEESKVVHPPTLTQQLSNVVSVFSADGMEYCSGWVLKGTHEVVTARHCTDDVVRGMIVDFGDGVPHIFHVRKAGDADLKTGPDLMTLTTNDDTIHWPDGLAVCSFKPYYGEALHLIGGPLRFEKTISFGYVANPDRDITKYGAGAFGKSMLQYDGSMPPGNSGSAAIDNSVGCVAGVVSRSLQINFGFPYEINFLTNVNALSTLN